MKECTGDWSRRNTRSAPRHIGKSRGSICEADVSLYGCEERWLGKRLIGMGSLTSTRHTACCSVSQRAPLFLWKVEGE
jgi:hypothetical protein